MTGRGVTEAVERPADINFYFDPVCPFAWITSKWVRQVMAAREYTVDWRFISLRLINSHIDYDAHFPPEYEAGHTAGLRLLRVAARTRAEHGRAALGPLYAAFGAHIFDSVPPASDGAPGGYRRGTREYVEPILDDAGLPRALAQALEESQWDEEIRAEGEEALALTGKDVGTPIIAFRPPKGVAFFGPVISRLPADDDAAELWDHVVALAEFPGFAELKRSLREKPQLRAFGGEFTHSESIAIDASPDVVYGIVSDVTRTGEWSPVCTRCTWDDGDGPRVGAHFTGYNEVPGRSWQTTSEVVAADPGREFAWSVGGGLVRWGYALEPADVGSRLTESWHFTEAGRQFFHDKYADTADTEIASRVRAAHEGIPVTLAAIKRIAEAD